jgi:glycerol-3-phosphate acyltransferase PlsY
MPKLDAYIATLHFEKQLIITAVCVTAVIVWLLVNNVENGWPFILSASFVILGGLLFIIKKSQNIKKLLSKIEKC